MRGPVGIELDAISPRVRRSPPLTPMFVVLGQRAARADHGLWCASASHLGRDLLESCRPLPARAPRPRGSSCSPPGSLGLLSFMGALGLRVASVVAGSAVGAESGTSSPTLASGSGWAASSNEECFYAELRAFNLGLESKKRGAIVR